MRYDERLRGVGYLVSNMKNDTVALCGIYPVFIEILDQLKKKDDQLNDKKKEDLLIVMSAWLIIITAKFVLKQFVKYAIKRNRAKKQYDVEQSIM